MENKEIAVFGGGCFWCVEAVFQKLKGVVKVTSGYAGGDKPDPSYEEVSSGKTGHAEVIQIEYEPEVISFKQLVEVFFEAHDPTTLNRQGHDVGTQYRSVVFYTSEAQKEEALEAIKQLELSLKYKKPVVTKVEELKKFYPAEGYHQNYYQENSLAPYCSIVIAPKIRHIEGKYKDWLRD